MHLVSWLNGKFLPLKFLVGKRCFEYSESAFVAAISMPSLADTLPIPILVCWAMNWQAKSLRLVLTSWALEQVIVARLTHTSAAVSAWHANVAEPTAASASVFLGYTLTEVCRRCCP